MQCGDVIRQLPEMLYDEIDEGDRRAIEAHLESCASCRREYESFRKTVRVLDEWSPIEAPADTRELARMIQGPAAPWWRRRPTWIGLAAGLLVFLGLMALNVSVQTGQGRVALSFGKAPSEVDTTTVARIDPEMIEPAVHQLVADRVETSTTLAGAAIADYLEDWTESHEQRQLAILSMLGRMREQDLAALDQRLRRLEEQQQRQAGFIPPQRFSDFTAPDRSIGPWLIDGALYGMAFNKQTGRFELQKLQPIDHMEDVQ